MCVYLIIVWCFVYFFFLCVVLFSCCIGFLCFKQELKVVWGEVERVWKDLGKGKM